MKGAVRQGVSAGVLGHKEDRGRGTRDLRHEFLADGYLEVRHIADCERLWMDTLRPSREVIVLEVR